MKLNLELLITAGIVMRNPGYGHPLRPEYILTQRGMFIGPAAQALFDLLPQRALGEIKWCLPCLSVLEGNARFGEVRSALPGITDRALSKVLKVLEESGAVARDVEPSYPPRVFYHIQIPELASAVKDFEGALRQF